MAIVKAPKTENIHYKIVIEKINIEVVKSKEWRKLIDSEAYAELRRGDPKLKQYGYVETEQEEATVLKIFEQLVEDVDLVKVIDAINK